MPSMVNEFVGYGARVHRQAVVVSDAAQLGNQSPGQIQLHQAEHLRIAVLLDHVDPIVCGDKVVHFAE